MSIVVPVYNVEKYLRECLDSLVNQTLKEIEIIVVNDCSPDNSEAIILEYAAKDDRIVYIKHEVNKCLGGARNTGIRAAKGKYITFVDSDDYVDRNLYKAAIGLFKKFNAQVVFLGFTSFSDKKRCLESLGIYKKSLKKVGINNFIDFNWAAWNKIYYLKDLQNKQIYFIENYYWEDILFWWDYCLVFNPMVVFLPQYRGQYHYRRREDSITGCSNDTYKQIPFIFKKMYLSLQKAEIISEGIEHFKKIITQQILWYWPGLTPMAQVEYLKNFDHFLNCLEFNEQEIEIFPEWYLYKKMNDLHSKKLFMSYYVKILENDYWRIFGSASSLQKIKMLSKYFIRRFLDKLKRAVS